MTKQAMIGPRLLADLINRFLAWPLPASLAATMPGIERPIGTHVMTADEAKAMLIHVLTPEAHAVAAAPVSAPMGQELPPQLTDEYIYALWSQSYTDALKEAGVGIGNGDAAHMNHPIIFAHAVERQVEIRYAERIRHLERELSEYKAARFAYASEFAPDADGEPDVGNIHANIRSLKRELAERKPASIGDDPEFRDLVDNFAGEVRIGFDSDDIERAKKRLIAYIDGRSAGTAPAPTVEAPRSREWQPVTGPGQVRKGDKLRFKIGDKAYNESAKLILNPGTNKEEVIYDKGRNFYFITAMVMSGFSNHKCVEVLPAAPTPTNTGREEVN